MRSSSGAFNYSLRTIPPLVSFGDYISEYLFAASRSSPRPTPLSLLRPSLAIYPLWLTPFTPLRAASLQACLLPTAVSSSSSSSSSIVGCYLDATDDGCCPLVLQSRNTPWPACHLSNRSRSHSAAPSGKSAAVCSVASQAETGLGSDRFLPNATEPLINGRVSNSNKGIYHSVNFYEIWYKHSSRRNILLLFYRHCRRGENNP